MFEKSLNNEKSRIEPLDQLRKLILVSALDAKQSIVISEGTLAFFYHSSVANSLAKNGFVLSPPAFTAPDPIEIRWGHWQGITHMVRSSTLTEYDEINGWTMNWLSQPTGQEFFALIKKINSSNLALKTNQPWNLRASDLLFTDNIPSEDFIRINYNYSLEGEEFESVPIYPAHLLKIIQRLNFNISVKSK